MFFLVLTRGKTHLKKTQVSLVALLEGTLFTFFSLAEAACLPRVVSQEHLSAAVAQNEAISSISWLLGPLLGGLLVGEYPFQVIEK